MHPPGADDAPPGGRDHHADSEGHDPGDLDPQHGSRPAPRVEEAGEEVEDHAQAAVQRQGCEDGHRRLPLGAVHDLHEWSAQRGEHRPGRQGAGPCEGQDRRQRRRGLLGSGEQGKPDGADDLRQSTHRPARDVEGQDVVAQCGGACHAGKYHVVDVEQGPGQKVRCCDRQAEGEHRPDHGAVQAVRGDDPREAELEDGRDGLRRDPTQGQSEDAEPQGDERQGDHGGHHEVREHHEEQLALLEPALQQAERHYGRATEEQGDAEHGDGCRRRRAVHGGGEGATEDHRDGREQTTAHEAEQADRRDDRFRVVGADDVGREPEVGDGHQDRLNGQRDGVDTELLGREDPGEDDADDKPAQSQDEGADAAPRGGPGGPRPELAGLRHHASRFDGRSGGLAGR